MELEWETGRLLLSSMLKQIPMNLDLDRNRRKLHSRSLPLWSAPTLFRRFEMVRGKMEPTTRKLELQIEFEEKERERKKGLTERSDE